MGTALTYEAQTRCQTPGESVCTHPPASYHQPRREAPVPFPSIRSENGPREVRSLAQNHTAETRTQDLSVLVQSPDQSRSPPVCNQQPSGEGMTGAQVGSGGLTSSMWTMASVGCGMKASDQSQASVWSTSTSPDTMRSFMRPTQGSVPQEGRASTSGCLRWRDTEGRHRGGPHVLSTFQASPGGRLRSSRGRQEAPGSTTGTCPTSHASEGAGPGTRAAWLLGSTGTTAAQSKPCQVRPPRKPAASGNTSPVHCSAKTCHGHEGGARTPAPNQNHPLAGCCLCPQPQVNIRPLLFFSFSRFQKGSEAQKTFSTFIQQ